MGSETAARQAIGDDVFEQRRAEGEAMSVDEAVGYALSLDESAHDMEIGEDADA